MDKLIGIDPDVEKSGFAVWDIEKKKFDQIDCLSFCDLIRQIERINKAYFISVYIEAGWLIKKSNFHSRKGQSKPVGEKISKSVGANHQIGKIFVECCEDKNIKVHQIKPQGKVNAKEFIRFTGWEGRTNSEKRDAAMLVFGR